MGQAPLYQSERNFRRYEKVINEICLAYPAKFVFRPQGLSPETVCARLRDAMKHLLHNRWSTYVDIDRVKLVRENMIVSHDGSKVTVRLDNGPKELEFNSDAVVNTPVCSDPTLEEILAFGLLITNRRMKIQVIFSNVQPSIGRAAEEHFESNPLIEFFQERTESNEWIML